MIHLNQMKSPLQAFRYNVLLSLAESHETSNPNLLRTWTTTALAAESVMQILDGVLEQAANLTRNQFFILVLLKHDYWNTSTGTLLAKYVGISGQAMSRVLKKMIANGWCERQVSLQDKRMYYIHLTEQGKALIEHVLPTFYSAINDYMGRFNQLELNALEHMLKWFNASEDDLFIATYLPEQLRTNLTLDIPFD